MLGPLLFIVVLVSCVGLLTVIYNRQPFKPLSAERPSFEFFPKYIANYEREFEEVELSIRQLGFRPNGKPNQYSRGTVRTGLTTKSIKLTIELDREKKQISIFSTFFGILFDNGDVWQLTNDAIVGLEPEKNRTQELVDLFDNKR